MKAIIINELIGNLHYQKNKNKMDRADLAFLCLIGKINDIRSRKLKRR